MDKKKLTGILKYVIGFGLGIVLLWLALRGVDFDEVKKGFREANYLWVFVGLMVAILSHWFRALRWKQLFKAAGYDSNTFNLFCSIMVGYMVNQAVPRAGEISRATLTSKTEKIPLSVSLGTMVTDRVFDVICLGLLVLFIVGAQFEQINLIFEKAFSQNPGDSAAGGGAGLIKWILLGLFLGGLAIFLIFFRSIRKMALYQKIATFLSDMWSAIKSVTKLEQPVLFIFYTLGIWVCYVLMTWLVFFALDATGQLPFMFALTAFTMGGIGMVFPSPGGIGSYHFAIIKTFVAYSAVLGWTEATAEVVGTNIAFIIHTSQLIMMIAVGFICYLFLVPKIRLAEKEPETAK